MLSPKESMRNTMYYSSNGSQAETKTKIEVMVPDAQDVWLLCMRPINREELLHGAKSMLFSMVLDPKVHIGCVLLQPRG